MLNQHRSSRLLTLPPPELTFVLMLTEKETEGRIYTHLVLEQIWVAVHKIPVAFSTHFILQERKRGEKNKKRESRK